ncbi:MAG: hypothetical protein ACOCQG_03230 [Candidatus Nanoarchaeia archaeon]
MIAVILIAILNEVSLNFNILVESIKIKALRGTVIIRLIKVIRIQYLS